MPNKSVSTKKTVIITKYFFAEVKNSKYEIKGADPFTVDEIAELGSRHSNPRAYKKFVRRLKDTFDEDKWHAKRYYFIQHLFELVLDNKLMELQDAANLAVKHGEFFLQLR